MARRKSSSAHLRTVERLRRKPVFGFENEARLCILAIWAQGARLCTAPKTMLQRILSNRPSSGPAEL